MPAPRNLMADFLRLKAPVHCRRRRRRHCRDSERTHGGSDRCPLSSWTPHKRGRQARSSKGHACPALLTARGCRKRAGRQARGLAVRAWAYGHCVGASLAIDGSSSIRLLTPRDVRAAFVIVARRPLPSVQRSLATAVWRTFLLMGDKISLAELPPCWPSSLLKFTPGANGLRE